MYGEAGNTTLTEVSTPMRIWGLDGPAKSVAVGLWHSCAVLNSGEVECWGNNGASELGLPHTPQFAYPTPQVVHGLLGPAIAIAAGSNHTCALVHYLKTTAVQCWGENTSWQLGTTAGTPISTGALAEPVPQHATAADGATAIAAGSFFSCAMLPLPTSPKAGASVLCWGHNKLGDLGRGYFSERQLPNSSQPVGITSGAYDLHAGPNADFACARIAGGQLRCWGSGVATPIAMPGAYAVTDFSESGWRNQCVVAAGSVLCALNQDSAPLSPNTPVLMQTPIASGATAVSISFDYACAIVGTVPNTKIQCWGANYYGQLGNGSFMDSPIPVDVLL
jgi:alpha-tubulin suppressor-like RCC1 family protein